MVFTSPCVRSYGCFQVLNTACQPYGTYDQSQSATIAFQNVRHDQETPPARLEITPDAPPSEEHSEDETKTVNHVDTLSEGPPRSG